MLPFFIALIENSQEADMFTALFNLYHGTMLQLANYWLKNQPDAEDVVQEVFEKLLESSISFDDSASPKTKAYLMAAVRNTAKNHIRSLTHYRQLTKANQTVAGPIVSAEEIFGYIEEKEAQSALTRAILQLSEDDRELLELAFAQKFTEEETATLLGVSRKTIYNRRKRIIQQLQQIMKEGDFID